MESERGFNGTIVARIILRVGGVGGVDARVVGGVDAGVIGGVDVGSTRSDTECKCEICAAVSKCTEVVLDFRPRRVAVILVWPDRVVIIWFSELVSIRAYSTVSIWRPRMMW